MKIKHRKHDWVVMDEQILTKYDSLTLPVWEEMTIKIMRRVTEDERKKCHEDRMKSGRGMPISYKELMLKLREAS